MTKTIKTKGASVTFKDDAGRRPIKRRPRKGMRKLAHKLVLRTLRLTDFPDIKEIMDRVYPEMGGAWTYEQFAAQLSHFPEGQICVEDGGRVVAAALALIVKYSDWGDKHTYAAITDNGTFSTHTASGDTLYTSVMAGLVPAIHADQRDSHWKRCPPRHRVDARDEHGHDDGRGEPRQGTRQSQHSSA